MNIPAFGATGRSDPSTLIYQGGKKLDELRGMASDPTIPPAQSKFNDSVVNYLDILSEATRASLVAHQASR